MRLWQFRVAAEIETAAANLAASIQPLVADLRRPADCDRIVAMTLSPFGKEHVFVDNAGLTFTTIDAARFRRPEPQKSGRRRMTSCAPSSRPTTLPPTKWPGGWRRAWSSKAGAAS